MLYNLLFDITSALLLLVVVFRLVRRRVTDPLGPSKYPFIGLLPNVLRSPTFKKLALWHKQFGHLVFFRVLGKPIAFIDGLEVADQLFNKHSAFLSNRPTRVIAHLCDYDKALAFMPQGDRCTRTRRQLHDTLNAKAIPLRYQSLEVSVQKFLTDLLDTPENLHGHIPFYYSSEILSFTLGYNATSQEDPLVDLSKKVAHNALSMMSLKRRPWAESFLVTRYLPTWFIGMETSRTIQRFKNDLGSLLARSDAFVKENLHDRDVSSSFLGRLLKKSFSDEDNSIAAYSSVSLYGGAVDTVTSLTTSFFMAMMLCPEAQATAQAEIDAVVGRKRMPTFADRPNLPYTEALVAELIRWAPPIPFVSRVVPLDMIHDGSILPSGTNVTASIWGMTHDDGRFLNPDCFQPERFYSPQEGRDAMFLEDSRKYLKRVVFGFGRRVCPGRFYADAWLWIVLTSVLATIKVSSPDGSPVVTPDFEINTIMHLPPFPCKLEPRFQGVSSIISS